MSEDRIVYERVWPATRCVSKYGDADGCHGGDRDGRDGGCDYCDVSGCDGGGRDGCDGRGNDGCDSNSCNVAGCNGGGSDDCDVAGCDGGGRDGCDGGESDGGVYVMVNPGVVVGAATSTEPAEPPAPAGGGDDMTGVRPVIHTISLK